MLWLTHCSPLWWSQNWITGLFGNFSQTAEWFCWCIKIQNAAIWMILLMHTNINAAIWMILLMHTNINAAIWMILLIHTNINAAILMILLMHANIYNVVVTFRQRVFSRFLSFKPGVTIYISKHWCFGTMLSIYIHFKTFSTLWYLYLYIHIYMFKPDVTTIFISKHFENIGIYISKRVTFYIHLNFFSLKTLVLWF